jgi:undecaprenyl-diphosphatase
MPPAIRHFALPLRDMTRARLDRLALREAGWLRGFNDLGAHPAVARAFSVISRLGDGVAWYSLMALLLAWDGFAALPAVLHMIVAGLLGTVTYKALKAGTCRPRPCDAHDGILCRTAPLDRFSFPSGHTLHAVIFSVVAIGYYPPLAWFVLPFTVLVALSRLILGLHYISDVLVGVALGLSIAGLTLVF